MSKMVLATLAVFVFGFVAMGCGGELEGAPGESAVLGTGQGSGVPQGEAQGDKVGEAQGDQVGEAQGDGLADCDEGYVPCGCEAQLQEKDATAAGDQDQNAVHDETATKDQKQLKVMDPEQCDGEPDKTMDQLKIYEATEVQEKIAEALKPQDQLKEQQEELGCCCLVE